MQDVISIVAEFQAKNTNEHITDKNDKHSHSEKN